MKIDRKEVAHVAQLARLSFTEEELDIFVDQLNIILEYFDTLQTLDTHDVEPTAHVVAMSNVFRDDEVRKTFDHDPLLAHVPAKEEKYFKVPKVIE